jgi:hypothetical protein
MQYCVLCVANFYPITAAYVSDEVLEQEGLASACRPRDTDTLAFLLGAQIGRSDPSTCSNPCDSYPNGLLRRTTAAART